MPESSVAHCVLHTADFQSAVCLADWKAAGPEADALRAGSVVMGCCAYLR